MTLLTTTLSENTAGSGASILAEWGLSILIETDDSKVLLDTGASISAVHNADSLGVDLSSIDKIVLSHGHYDHTGGLREMLRRMNKEIEIIAHPDVWGMKYHRRKDDPERYIGIPFQRNELESLGARFVLSEKPVNIADGIITTGEIPMITEYEAIDPGLYVKEDGVFQPDQLLDDRAIIVKTARGLVIILGCAHRGMINTIYHAREITGVNEIYAVIGGSHLVSATEECLWQSIAAIRELEVQKLALCHCTDLPVISVLAQEFGENFIFNKAGSRLDFS
ncbi:MAG: MBL fold metallo-hydrolase [Dehalococcoidales bacterium]|nr:MBL fold metallo-hydrolase [Dehalococcoidales bacterium]